MPLFPPGTMELFQRQAQKYILSGLQRKMSANAILKDLISKTLGYRRTTFLKDVKYWQNALMRADYLKFTNFSSKFNVSHYIQTGWQTKGRFETVIEVTTRDRMTGLTSTNNVTVVHTTGQGMDERVALTQDMTRQEVEDAARDMVEPYYEGGLIEFISAKPVIGYYNPDVS